MTAYDMNIVAWLGKGKPVPDEQEHLVLTRFVNELDLVSVTYRAGTVTLRYELGGCGLAWKFDTSTMFLSREPVAFWDERQFFETTAGKFRWYLYERLVRDAGDAEVEPWEKPYVSWNNLVDVINKCIPAEGVFAQGGR